MIQWNYVCEVTRWNSQTVFTKMCEIWHGRNDKYEVSPHDNDKMKSMKISMAEGKKIAPRWRVNDLKEGVIPRVGWRLWRVAATIAAAERRQKEAAMRDGMSVASGLPRGICVERVRQLVPRVAWPPPGDCHCEGGTHNTPIYSHLPHRKTPCSPSHCPKTCHWTCCQTA